MSISNPMVGATPVGSGVFVSDRDEAGVERARGWDVATLVRRYGGPLSSGLLDPSCALFAAPGIEGAVGYRAAWGCAVAIGDPVCANADAGRLADAFRMHCRERGWHTAYAGAGRSFAELARSRGYALIEFGEELLLDPRRDPQAGPRGRELRKKVNHARRAGLCVVEYDRTMLRDPALEVAMENTARAWLAARQGPQIYLAHVSLFDAPEARRWFYALHEGRVVGVLCCLRLESRGGYLLEHILAAPDAPGGTSESLIVAALAAFGAENCAFATFGPAPAPQIGRIEGLGRRSERLARQVYAWSNRTFHLDARSRFRRKFQVSSEEPAFLLFDPPRVGVREVFGLMRAFNVSLGRIRIR